MLADAVAGELIAVGDRDPLAAAATTFADAARRPARGPRRACSASRPTTASLLGATGTHPWSPWQEQQIIDTEHYQPRRARASSYVAWRNNTFCRPRPRGRPRGRPRDRRLRPAARAAARAARDLGQLAVPRRPRLGPALGAHADLHQELPALRDPRRRSATGRPTPTTSTSSCATNSIVEHTQLWWSVRPHHAYGTVEVRICDAQSSAEESTALAGLIVACVAQAALDYDEGVPLDAAAGRG